QLRERLRHAAAELPEAGDPGPEHLAGQPTGGEPGGVPLVVLAAAVHRAGAAVPDDPPGPAAAAAARRGLGRRQHADLAGLAQAALPDAVADADQDHALPL